MKPMADPIKSLFDAPVDALRDLTRITNALPNLSEAERMFVRHILKHPADITRMSVAEFADAAGVSEATIFRLCRQFGLGGYNALRTSVAQAIELYGTDFVSAIPAHFDSDPNLGPMHSGLYVGMRTLLDASTLEEEKIEEASNIILNSQRLIVCGMGVISARLAELAAFGFQHMGFTAMVWIDSQVENADPALIHPTDAVLAISHSGANETLAQFLKRAKEAGAKTIAISNYQDSRVTNIADIALTTSGREPFVQNLSLLPRISQIVVIQVLVNHVASLHAHATKDSNLRSDT